MVKCLCHYLLEKLHLYLDERVTYIQDIFQKEVLISSIRQALVHEGWIKKKAKTIAREQNAALRDGYLYFISDFQPKPIRLC